MIALPFKDIPMHWHGVYYSAWLNLFVSVANILIGNTFMAGVSVGITIGILYYIKRKVQAEIWQKLQQQNYRTNWNDNDYYIDNTSGP